MFYSNTGAGLMKGQPWPVFGVPDCSSSANRPLSSLAASPANHMASPGWSDDSSSISRSAMFGRRTVKPPKYRDLTPLLKAATAALCFTPPLVTPSAWAVEGGSLRSPLLPPRINTKQGVLAEYETSWAEAICLTPSLPSPSQNVSSVFSRRWRPLLSHAASI
jgi:hypothetical protein